MRLEHPDYIKLVMASYQKKRASNELSILLIQPTPANIRSECLNVYVERYNKIDDHILRAFFGPVRHGKEFLQAIEAFPADRFKPLCNYLKGETEKTDDKNLELLAWLIDFKLRPFVFGKEVILSDNELLIIGKLANKESGGEPHPDIIKTQGGKNSQNNGSSNAVKSGDGALDNTLQFNGNERKNKNTRTSIIIIALVGFLGVGYFFWQLERSKQSSFGKAVTGCMYWAGDHYESMPCNEERVDVLKLPLNEQKLKNFKRITVLDTITEKSIGKVHYLKINGGIEYYTASGKHPIEVTRTLRPLTFYMFNKYLRNGTNNKADSIKEESSEFVNNR